MKEIEKFKKRLNNASPGSTEFRMTIVEARKLLEEIQTVVAAKTIIQEQPAKPVVNEPAIITRTIDGGAF